jgi:hypothetical protein
VCHVLGLVISLLPIGEGIKANLQTAVAATSMVVGSMTSFPTTLR